MYCYQDTCFNTKGDALPGYYVECLSGASVQDIFADNSSTPIVSVSGVANRAKTDARGNFFFYVAGGTYTLKYYDSNSVYQFSSPEFSVSEQVVSTAETSAGVADAGKVPVLDATGGRLDRTVLAPDGRQRQKRLILSDTGDVSDMAADGGPTFSGTMFDSFLQLHGTSQTDTGWSVTKWGDDNKGARLTLAKSRGASYGDFATTQAGDRVASIDMQVAYGASQQFGHAGSIFFLVDGTTDGNSETAGRMQFYTGTGNNIVENGTYYGVRCALDLNRHQQAYLPGKLTSAPPAADTNFGAILRVGKGGTGTGEAAMLFDLTGAALMTTPVAGAYEVDSSGGHYITDVNAKRDAVLVGQVKVGGDSGAIAAGTAAGSGPTISVVWGNGCARVTLTTGTSATTGDVCTITYPHTFANRSFVFLQGANTNAATFVGRNIYTTATTSAVTLTTPTTPLASSTAYIIDVIFIGN